ncbi:MAG TPA: hypothetical protein VJ803_06080 [Gemmatimonadaceae bacterium]|nr:hypothetical protein [Gemmatimonadaceae bacterium]
MKHRWAALVFGLALGALVPRSAEAQEPNPPPNRERTPGVELGQNYPNPFNPTTTIPFTLGDYPSCADAHVYRVTLQIYNIVAQMVAIPILQGGTAAGQQLVELQLPCGTYTAYWDGRDVNSREVSSGVYLYRLVVDGKVYVKKMLVMK